jgi:hypothetical protein
VYFFTDKILSLHIFKQAGLDFFMNVAGEEPTVVRLPLLYIEEFAYKESENERATSLNISPEDKTTHLGHELLDHDIFQPV